MTNNNFKGGSVVKSASIFMGTLVMLALTASLCMAGNPFGPPINEGNIRIPSVDVGIRIAGASNCPCSGEIERSGAMYFKDIKALVDTGRANAPIGVTVTAKYYDLVLGRTVTKTKHAVLRHTIM